MHIRGVAERDHGGRPQAFSKAELLESCEDWDKGEGLELQVRGEGGGLILPPPRNQHRSCLSELSKVGTLVPFCLVSFVKQELAQNERHVISTIVVKGIGKDRIIINRR